MENNQETDKFKQAFREKLGDRQQFTERDADLWKKVQVEIEHVEAKVYKINHLWIAVAATLLLFLSVSIALFLKTDDNGFISQHPDITKNKTITPNPSNETKEINTESEKEEIQKNPEEGKNVTSPIATKPADVFENAKIVKAEEKIQLHNLPDGSMISLNNESVIKVPASYAEGRTILLEEGEAYFEVKSDKSKPFTVSFSDYKLEVVGTMFNIRNLKNEGMKEITVVEGIVRVYDNVSKEGILVKKGEQLHIGKGQKSVLSTIDAPKYISWKTGNLDFNKTRMEEVATVLSRKFDKEIILSPQLKNCKFTGDLSNLTEEEAFEVIKLSNSVKIETVNKKLYITGPSCD